MQVSIIYEMGSLKFITRAGTPAAPAATKQYLLFWFCLFYFERFLVDFFKIT